MKPKFLILTTVLLLLLPFTLIAGAVDIPASEVWRALSGGECSRPSWQYIVMENRLPQLLTSLLAGSSLAITGLMLQTAFRNPLAGPGIFGVNTGASLGVAIVMLLFGGNLTAGFMSLSGTSAILGGALIGALAVMAIIFAVSVKVRSNTMLLIVGIMVGYLASSAISLLNFFSTAEGVHSYVIWGMGTFSAVTMAQMPVFAIACIIGIFASLLLVKPLNTLLLGDAYAQNLGVNPLRIRNMLLLLTGWLTAVVTAYCGPIGFIGLAVPHIARLIFSTDNHLVMIPATILCGALTGVLCNLICVLPGDAGIIPLNAVTPLIGAPVVIYIILSQSRR